MREEREQGEEEEEGEDMGLRVCRRHARRACVERGMAWRCREWREEKETMEVRVHHGVGEGREGRAERGGGEGSWKEGGGGGGRGDEEGGRDDEVEGEAGSR